jgi:hypothetical protein
MIRQKTMSCVAAATTAIAILVSVPAWAHHSHSMFDDSREVTLTGTVTAVRFQNPHVFVLIEIENETGDTQRWTLEMSTVRNMISRGVNPDTFQIDGELVIRVNPLRNGQSGGNYTRILSIDGVPNTADGGNWASE